MSSVGIEGSRACEIDILGEEAVMIAWTEGLSTVPDSPAPQALEAYGLI